MKSSRAAYRRHLPGSPFNTPEPPPPPAESYVVDDRVTHDKYGLGTVIGVEEGTAVLIDFGAQKLRIKMPCSKLARL